MFKFSFFRLCLAPLFPTPLSLSLLDNKGTEAGGAASSGADYGRKGGMGA